MRIFLSRWKRFCIDFFALFFVTGVFAAILCGSVNKFSDLTGERTFYLYSASSQATVVETLRLKDIPSVKGQSVRFACDLKSEEDFLVFAENLAQKYGAEIVKEESVCGITSYYAYTPRWNESVYIYEKTVNLHIAFNGETCVVGYPIVFGGF